MERKSIGSFIAVLRKANGLTQRELAEKLGVSDKAVSRWERDETAPDLYLIPTIAEIFGVTSDELLRGERTGENAPPTEKQSEKTERQIKTVLKAVRTKFLTKSLICVLIAVIGLLAAMLCNFGFYRAELGFYIGLIFFMTSAVMEIIFAVLALSGLDAEEFGGEHLSETRKYIIKKTEALVFLAFILLAYCFPLVIETNSTSFINIRVDFGGWLFWGSVFAGIAATICAAANLMLDKKMEKKGIYTVDENIVRRRKLAKIRFASPLIPIAKIFIPLIAITVVVNILCLSIFDYEFFLRGKGTEWTDVNAFVEYMEENIDQYGEPEDDDYVHYPTYKIWLDDKQISFCWNNRTVEYFNVNGITSRDVESGKGGMIMTQIYPDGVLDPDFSQNEAYDIPGFYAVTYSREEAYGAREWAYDIEIYFTLAYVAEALALAVTYTVMVAKKFKKTSE